MLLRQPVEYFGQDVTLAYVLGRVAIKEEAEVRKQAIRSALEQAHGWQRDKYCIIVGTEDEIRPLLSVLPSSPVTVVTLGEHARTALARYGCPADRKHGALFRLSTPDGSPLQAFVLTAAGDSFLYYADATTTLRVG
jgi:hypothetical protein